MTSQYLTIFTTHSQIPLAALDLDFITSGSKLGIDKNSFLTKATFGADTRFWSTVSLKLMSLVRKSSGFFINFKLLFQSQVLGFLFLSTSIASGQNPASIQIQAENTSPTPPGGLLKDLAVWKSFLEMEFKAAFACSIKGPAASRSASVEAFFSVTSSLILAQLSCST
jgi:hypothetical protein